MSVIESGVPDVDTDFTSHSPQKTRKPCFFVQYVFNVTKSIRNCRLVSPLGVFFTLPTYFEVYSSESINGFLAVGRAFFLARNTPLSKL